MIEGEKRHIDKIKKTLGVVEEVTLLDIQNV